MNTAPLQHPITEQSVTTGGINEDYAWYQAKVLADSLDAVKFNLRRVITVLEARRADNLHVIDELLRENKALKEKLKEKGE